MTGVQTCALPISLTGANTTPLLESPGFLMLNYGPQTPLATLVAHIAYGAIVGGFTQLTTS